MNRIVKALGAFALTLVLVLSLAATGLCATAQEFETEPSSSGYLVILKEPEADLSAAADDEGALFGLQATLFAAQSEREELLPLAEEMGIYKAGDLDSIQNLVWSDQVELVEPDYEAQLLELDIDHPADPNDDYFQSNYQYNLTDINAQSAWDAGLTGEGVTVAVIDSGINVDHLDVPVKVGRGRYYFYREEENGLYTFDGKKYNFYSNDNVSDNLGHGTAVSGVLAANTNNRSSSYTGGIAGIAPNVTLMPVRCFTKTEGHLGGYTSNLIGGINYAVENGADVINMSWGIYSRSTSLERTINNAANAGCILIAAAGNDGRDSVHRHTLQYPASFPNVISVGSTNKQGGLSDFSQRTAVDVCAPGNTIYSLLAEDKKDVPSKDGIVIGNGTSFSAPLVAGAAALLLEHNPFMTQEDFMALLRDTSDLNRIAAADRPYAGYGMLNLKKLLSVTGHTGAMLRYGEGGAVTIRAAHFPAAGEGAGDQALVMLGAYNPAGHLLDSRIALSDQAAGYGAFSLTATFHSPEAATLKAYFLDSATLVPLGPPVEVTIAQ